jgi:hypothetical protein
VIEKWVYQKSQQKYATKVNKCNWRVPILWTFKQFGSDRKNQIQRRKIMSTQSVKPVLSSEKTILKVRKAVIPNHSQAALKVRKTDSQGTQHNQSALKVRKGTHVNHNQSALKIHKSLGGNSDQIMPKVRKCIRANYNESALRVRKDLHENHNQNMLSAQRHYQQS